MTTVDVVNQAADPQPAVERWTKKLHDQGYCVIPGLVAKDLIRTLDSHLDEDFAGTPFCEGGFYGERTRRFGRLLVRSPLARDLV